MRVNAMTEKFEDVTVLGHPMLFTCARVDRDTVPEGLYMYEVRHDDDQQGDPVQIANWIMVNHWGTLITNKPIRLEPSKRINNAYRDIDPEEDWNYEGSVTTVRTMRSQTICSETYCANMQEKKMRNTFPAVNLKQEER